jgi:hypothetical protein
MTELSPAQAVLCAYRDLSWTPDEEDNGKYLKFSHKAGMAAALRAAADQVVPEEIDLPPIAPDPGHFRQHERRLTRRQLLAIAAELENR